MESRARHFLQTQRMHLQKVEILSTTRVRIEILDGKVLRITNLLNDAVISELNVNIDCDNGSSCVIGFTKRDSNRPMGPRYFQRPLRHSDILSFQNIIRDPVQGVLRERCTLYKNNMSVDDVLRYFFVNYVSLFGKPTHLLVEDLGIFKIPRFTSAFEKLGINLEYFNRFE